jgi:hypothetical protein
MHFTVMNWESPTTRSNVFGVVDAANPKLLPTLSPKGFWAHFADVEGARFAAAEAAEAAIAAHGFYLLGATDINLPNMFGSLGRRLIWWIWKPNLHTETGPFRTAPCTAARLRHGLDRIGSGLDW